MRWFSVKKTVLWTVFRKTPAGACAKGQAFASERMNPGGPANSVLCEPASGFAACFQWRGAEGGDSKMLLDPRAKTLRMGSSRDCCAPLGERADTSKPTRRLR